MANYYENHLWIAEGCSHWAKQTCRPAAARPIFHYHEFCEITWITEGEVEHITGQGRAVLFPGDVIFVLPQHTHSYRPAVDNTRIYNIMLLKSALQRFSNDYFGSSFEFWASESEPAVRTLDFEKLSELCAAFNELSMVSRQRFHLDRFLHNVFGIFDIAPPSQQSHVPDWLTEGLRVLQTPEVLSGGLAALQQACGRSPKHITRTCREHLNITPGRLVQNARLEHAAELLLETDEEITQIAFTSGYNDLAHFYRHFNRRYGTSPGKYRGL